jgi:hypothetical protein
LAGVVEEPAAADGTDDTLSVLGDGGVEVLRSQPAASASETAAASAINFIVVSGMNVPYTCK